MWHSAHANGQFDAMTNPNLARTRWDAWLQTRKSDGFF
jgi:hypothetical protein